jgi:hypothetical protein
MRATGITITGGDEVGHNQMGLTVPKATLVSALSVVVQTQRIKVAPGLPAVGSWRTRWGCSCGTRTQSPDQFASGARANTTT